MPRLSAPLAAACAALALSAALLAGCSKSPEAAPGPPTHEAPAKAAEETPMKPADDPFQAARSHMAKAVAAARGKAVDAVEVSPPSRDRVGADFEDLRIGALVPLYAKVEGTPADVRGFADPEGNVVLAAKPDSYAALIAAGESKGVDAPGLARRVTWVMGPGHVLIYEPEFAEETPPPPEMPTLERKDGATTLSFVLEQAGDTGVQIEYRITLTVKADGSVDFGRARP